MPPRETAEEARLRDYVRGDANRRLPGRGRNHWQDLPGGQPELSDVPRRAATALAQPGLIRRQPAIPAGIPVNFYVVLDHATYCAWRFATHPMPLAGLRPPPRLASPTAATI
jgi:hypothetical protein